MNESWGRWSPDGCILLWRVAALLTLASLWAIGRSGAAGIALLLFLSTMAIARRRFRLPVWTVAAEQAACWAAALYWPDAWYALALPVFEAILGGRGLLALPALLSAAAYAPASLPLFAALLHAALAGLMLRSWSAQTAADREKADRERFDRYELQQLRDELLRANAMTGRMAALSERQKLAQRLHDHAGHDLTAASLALQAFEPLWKEGDPRAAGLLEQARIRLADGMTHLREAAHDVAPATPVGMERLEDICRKFQAIPIRLQANGDTSAVPSYVWSILEPCLKEGLTNAARHASAQLVDVTVDVNAFIVRLCVHDDGVGGTAHREGIGLRNLRQRARAIGGSVSADTVGGFRLVCVLPLGRET